MGRERRRRSRRTGRSTPAGPTTPAAAQVGGEPVEGVPAPVARPRPSSAPSSVQVRSDRVIERESAMMLTELKRVGWVSAVCFGMLAVLVVVERFS